MDQKEVARRLERIRKTVREQLAMEEPTVFDDAAPQEAPFELRPGVGVVVSGDPSLTTTPELEAANRSVDPTSPLPSHVAFFGPVITFVRRLLQPFVKVLLGGHLRRQQEFNSQTVRHLNKLGQRLEQRVRNLEEALELWSANPSGIEARLKNSLDEYDAALRQRIVTLLSALEEEMLVARGAAESVQRLEEKFVERSEAIDQRFIEKDKAFNAAVSEVSDRQGALGAAFGRLEGHTAELLGMRTVLKRAIERSGAKPVAVGEGAGASEAPDGGNALSKWMGDEDYRAFQASFRGDPEEVLERMRGHIAFFDGVKGEVADLGCGRGEFLGLLSEAGIGGVGVETNAADVEECTSRGHEAIVADLFEWLEEQPEGELGGIFMAQVIEHLPPPQWQRLVELAVTRLEPGGRLAIETINPESLYALVRAYVIDPTHVRPVHPELLAFLARRAGFHPVEVHFQTPVPDEERPTGLPLFDPSRVDDPAGELAEIKEALSRLDRLCCAPQEYTLHAVRPSHQQSD